LLLLIFAVGLVFGVPRAFNESGDTGHCDRRDSQEFSRALSSSLSAILEVPF
jgi:hypothetical protein